MKKSETELSLGLCVQSLKTAEKGLELNPYNIAFLVRKGQALLCEREFEKFDAWAKDAQKYSVPLEYLKTYQAQSLFFKKEFGKALSLLSEVLAGAPNYPEAWYWRAQILGKVDGDSNDSYEKYLKICEGSVEKIKKKYIHEPRVCREVGAVRKIVETAEATEE